MVHEGELAVQSVAGHELVAALAAVQVRGVRARCHLQNNNNKRTMTVQSSLGRYVFGSEISYNKAPPRLPGLAY